MREMTSRKTESGRWYDEVKGKEKGILKEETVGVSQLADIPYLQKRRVRTV